ncbi:MAG: CBS domain-containing protein [Desulfamplus sp.]|nr:CBS domain-containing protein [Desulfamplus sp.]
MRNNTLKQCTMGFTDDDIVEAMKNITGYLDITPSDFKEIYLIASKHALERLKNSIKAEDVMTTTVVTVTEQTTLLDAAKIMANNNISGLPVMDDKKNLSGIISEKDFLRKMVYGENISFMNIIAKCLEVRGCIATNLKHLCVKDIMSSPPVTVEKSLSIMDVATIFESYKINRVPVLDKNSNLAGIIARSDIVTAFC